PRALVRGRTVEQVAVEAHRTGLVAQRAADAIDQRALAGAVRSDQANAFACGYRERDVLQRDEAAEALAQPVDLEELAHGTGSGASVSTFRRPTKSSGLCWTYRCTSPTIPFGAMMTKATRTQPTIRRLTADEIVTVASCCSEPSRMAPTSGPTQLVV